MILKYGPMRFPVVSKKYGTLSQHFQLGPFMANFVFYSITGPFVRTNKELGCSRELYYMLKIEFMKLACIILQVQFDVTNPLGFEYP